MAGHRTYSVALKRQIVQEYVAGETLHRLAHRHNLPRNLIRLWVDENVGSTRGGERRETSPLEDLAALAQTLHECETRIEAIERLVARRAAQFGTRHRERPPGKEPGDASDGPC